MSITAKHATDRIASFLPTATVAAYQLILSSYPLKGECSVGQVCNGPVHTEEACEPPFCRLCSHSQAMICVQSVLLWITLWVLTLVTAGMAMIQHRNETDEGASVWDHLSTGGSTAVYPWARAIFSAVAFFFVSFLTPPAPQCLIPQTPIPSGAAWIVAVLLGSIMTLGALVFPTNVSELRGERAAARTNEEVCTVPLIALYSKPSANTYLFLQSLPKSSAPGSL